MEEKQFIRHLPRASVLTLKDKKFMRGDKRYKTQNG